MNNVNGTTTCHRTPSGIPSPFGGRSLQKTDFPKVSDDEGRSSERYANPSGCEHLVNGVRQDKSAHTGGYSHRFLPVGVDGGLRGLVTEDGSFIFKR